MPVPLAVEPGGQGVDHRQPFLGALHDGGWRVRSTSQNAQSVLLTTHDDAVNIYLAAYCRRLNPALHIASRITHERNIDAIHRAGADFVLSYASLGVSSVFSLLQGKDLVVLGEGLDLFTVPVPRSLAGRPLAESGIGAQTGLLVIGIQTDGEALSAPPPSTPPPLRRDGDARGHGPATPVRRAVRVAGAAPPCSQVCV